MKSILMRFFLSAVFIALPFVMNHYEIYWWSTGAVDKFLFPPEERVGWPSDEVYVSSSKVATTPILLNYAAYIIGLWLFFSGVYALIRLLLKRRKAAKPETP